MHFKRLTFSEVWSNVDSTQDFVRWWAHIWRAKCHLKSCSKEVKCRSNVQRKKSVSSIFSGCFFFSSSILRFLIWLSECSYSAPNIRRMWAICFCLFLRFVDCASIDNGVINVNRIIYWAARRELWLPMFWRNDNIIIYNFILLAQPQTQ